MEAYIPILEKLTNARINHLIIGTWALKYSYPEKMVRYQVTDCDILIENDLNQIRNCISQLMENDWVVTCWEEEVDDQVRREDLAGKFYLRATKPTMKLDITYECPFFEWQEMHNQKVVIDQLPMASLNHILSLKKIKGTDQDLKVAKWFE